MSAVELIEDNDEVGPVSSEQVCQLPQWDHALVQGALELLFDAIQPPRTLSTRLDQLKSRIRQSMEAAEIADLLTQAANLVAETRFEVESRQQEQAGFLDTLVAELGGMDRSLQGSEQQSQAAFQGTQKVGNALEKNLTDMASRLRKASSLEGVKIFLNQRIGVLHNRLEDFQQKGTQQHAMFHGSMQSLVTSIRQLHRGAEEVQTSLTADFDESLVDSLTGMGNRIACERKLREVLEQEGCTNAVLQLWNMDRLASINQKYSWRAGNRTLQVVAKLLQRQLRKTDFIARFGSDQFVILLPQASDETAREVAVRLCKAVASAGIHHKGEAVEATISCGYTRFQEGDQPRDTLQRAESALSRVKEQGGNCFLAR